MRNFIRISLFTGIKLQARCSAAVAVITAVLQMSVPAQARDTAGSTRADTASINGAIRTALDLQNPDSAISMFRTALRQSETIGYPDGAFNALMQMGILYREKDDYRQMEATMKQALGWAYKAKRTDALAWWCNNIGDLYLSQGNYTQAAACFYQALHEIGKVPGPSITKANITINLGYLYKLLGQPRKAMAFYTDAEQVCTTGGYDYQLAGVYINKGAYYVDNNQPDSALWCFNRVMTLARKLNLTDITAIANSGTGASLVKAGAYEKAVSYLRTAIAMAAKNYPEIARDAAYYLGDALLGLKQYREAEALLVKALNETKAVNTRYNYIQSYAKLIKVYRATGRYKEAIDLTDSLMALKDSMMSADNAVAISQMEVKYKTAEKDRELTENRLLITRQNNKLARKNILIASVVSGIVVLSLLGLLLYRNIKSKEKLQEEQIINLQRENTISMLKGVVQGEETERERLARELHDGIGGLLSAAIMRFMAIRHTYEPVVHIQAYEEGMTMLDELLDEIRKTAHNLTPVALLTHSLPDALRSYCHSVQDGSELRIDVQCYGDFDSFGRELKLNVYRIIQELVKNIVAHAGATQALVQLIRNDGLLSLTVEDNGAGFDTLQPTEGIGLHNLRTRVTGMQGHLTIVSEPGTGTSVYVEFDLATLYKTRIYENQDSHSR